VVNKKIDSLEAENISVSCSFEGSILQIDDEIYFNLLSYIKYIFITCPCKKVYSLFWAHGPPIVKSLENLIKKKNLVEELLISKGFFLCANH